MDDFLIDGYSENEILYDTGKTPGDDYQQAEVRVKRECRKTVLLFVNGYYYYYYIVVVFFLY